MSAVVSTVRAAVPSARRPSAGDLCLPVPSISPETDNAAVLRLFSQHKGLVGLPVVENGRPFGLINRHIFLSQMARPFQWELYARKSCIAFMDKSPLVVDAKTSIDEMVDLAVAYGDKSLADGFIITSSDHYQGIGLGIDLVRAVSEMHARQHHQIMQSIEYASVIQGAMLATSRQEMAATLNDWCLTWEPRDHVGGDYYHFTRHDRGWLAVIVDCTGHGVPGAFMTLIFSSALERALALHGPSHPGVLLQEINGHIKDALGQIADRARGTQNSNDGCDAILVAMDTSEGRLRWSSARMPAFILSAATGELASLTGDRMGAGYTETPRDYVWPTHEKAMEPGDVFFTTTDGLTDQIGGERRIMYGKRRLQGLLKRCRELPMPALGEELLCEHRRYQDSEIRRDDLTFWGWRA
ncbi:MAG: SpoIIE family protein phosphatase [Ectothiorhodospiraceae bacterium]|jgi:serine phosphatase RsbU (regulator of sigma subunit)|nr:SpoIIE family protein phosphatase [Ectothiorhodospiraceae bacterium]